jgi:molybdate transport system ATP-binding protein
MTLEANVKVSLGHFDLDVDITAADGETVVVLGPNGAGKTTLLRAVAGLVPLDAGRIAIDDDVLDEPGAGIWIPSESRPIGVVFQDYLLFPHLSALENIAFGLRAHGMARGAAREQAREHLTRVGLGEHADVRPGALSGGQAQRVALARALVLEPRLLLLDEPLAALDAAARVEVRRELQRDLAAFPGVRILVTHDPIDAFALAARVVIIENGRVQQAGTLDEIRARPRSRFIADLVGMNLYAGVLTGDRLQVTDGGEIVVANDDDTNGDAFAVIHPEAVTVHVEEPAGSSRNVWRGRIRDLDDQGRRVRLHVDADVPVTAEITQAARSALGLEVGSTVWVSVKATEIATYAA